MGGEEDNSGKLTYQVDCVDHNKGNRAQDSADVMGKVNTAAMGSRCVDNKPPADKELKRGLLAKSSGKTKMIHTKSAETKAAVAFLVFVAVNQMQDENASTIDIARTLA